MYNHSVGVVCVYSLSHMTGLATAPHLATCKSPSLLDDLNFLGRLKGSGILVVGIWYTL